MRNTSCSTRNTEIDFENEMTLFIRKCDSVYTNCIKLFD